MGNEAPAEKLAAWYERELGDIKQRVSRAKKHPLVYYGRSASGLQTGGKGSINVEGLEVLGARNAATEARAGLVTVSFEQVLLWNPEVILTTDPNFWTSVWTDPRWRAVSAVEQKRVYLSPHLPFGWFDFPPGANRLLGLWWAGKLLYPRDFRRRPARQGDRVPPPVLSPRADSGAARRTARRAGRAAEVTSRSVSYVVAAGALVALTALAFAVGRYPVSPV